MENNNAKEQAQYIWNRLDDLANNDPSAYKTFIEQQMKEKEIYMSNPEATFCIQTTAQLGSETVNVYINVMSWKRMPDVKSDNDPVQIMPGKKSKYRKNKGDKFSMCLPIAVNDRFLGEVCKNSFLKEEFINLCLELVRKKCKVPVLKEFKLHKELFVGILPANPRSLFLSNEQLQDPMDKLMSKEGGGEDIESLLSSPESLLQRLSTEKSKATSSVNDSDKKLIDEMLSNSKESSNIKPARLIEEIDTQTNAPDYQFVDGDGMKLRINLPFVESFQQCDLSVSKDKVLLKVVPNYELKLDLPKSINDSEVSARFSKKSSKLTLCAPFL